jgi:hypothetical protein
MVKYDKSSDLKAQTDLPSASCIAPNRKVKSVQGAKLVFYHVLSFYLAVANPSIFVSYPTFFGCPMPHYAPQLQRKIALRNFSSFVSICSLSDGASAGITTNGTGGS